MLPFLPEETTAIMRPYVRFEEYPDSPAARHIRRLRVALFWLLALLLAFFVGFFIDYRGGGDNNGTALIGALLMGLPLGFFSWLLCLLVLFIFRR